MYVVIVCFIYDRVKPMERPMSNLPSFEGCRHDLSNQRYEGKREKIAGSSLSTMATPTISMELNRFWGSEPACFSCFGEHVL